MSEVLTKAPDVRAAALAAMESAAPAETIAADAPIAEAPVKVEGLETPTTLQEKPRGEDGKFLKKGAREALAKAMGGAAVEQEAEAAVDRTRNDSASSTLRSRSSHPSVQPSRQTASATRKPRNPPSST